MQPEALEALSADIHLLGDLLGETIRRLDGRGGLRPGRGGPRRRPRSSGPTRRSRRPGGSATGSVELDLPELRTLIRRVQHLFRPDQPGRAAGPRPGPPGPQREADGTPRAETPEAALRQLHDRGVDAGRGRRAPGAGPDLPGLHRPPERGPAADDPRQARRHRPPARPARARPTPSPPSGRGPSRRSPRRSRPSGSPTRSGRPGRRSSTRSARASARRGEPPRRRPSGLPEARGGPGGSIPAATGGSRRSSASGRGSAATATATPASPPRHRRGRPAPAGDPPPPLPRRGWTTSGGGSATPTDSSSPARPCSRVAGEGRRALPRGARRAGARAVPGEVPADLRQAPQDARIRPASTPAWAGEARPPPPGVYLGREALLADLRADRRRPPPGRRRGRRGRGDPAT